jgi:drug/metabolite transporter (DMT)-like permease
VDKRDHAIGVASLFLTAICWGFVASTVKRLTARVDPYTISFFRVSLATAMFLTLLVLQRKSVLRIQWLLPWIAVGALGRAGNYLLYNAGLVYMPSNAATILAPVQTTAVVLLARWILGEQVRPKWLGLGLSLSGLLLIWWNGQGWKTLMELRYYGGNALLVLAGVASALQFISQKALSSKLSSLEILLPVFGWSTAITLPFAWGIGTLGQSYSLVTWLWLLFLGLILTGGSFLFLAEGYQRCAATTAVVITNTTVFWTLIWSHYLLHESVGVIMVVGALLGVAGAVLVVRADRQAMVRVPAS